VGGGEGVGVAVVVSVVEWDVACPPLRRLSGFRSGGVKEARFRPYGRALTGAGGGKVLLPPPHYLSILIVKKRACQG
jgi:hypothetical protein